MQQPRSPPPKFFYAKAAMEELGKFLHNAGWSVESILRSYTASTVKTSEPEVLDVRTTLSMGIVPSIHNGMHEILQKASYDDSVAALNLRSTQFLPSSSNNVQCLDIRNWLNQKQSSLMSPQKASGTVGALEYGDNNWSVRDDALRGLLEEIKKTVCNWSFRHKTMQQDIPLRQAPQVAQDGAAAGTGVRLLDDPESAAFEGRQNSARPVHSSQGNMSEEVGIQVRQHQKEVEKDTHPKQNGEGRREEILLSNSSEQSFRDVVHLQLKENAQCSCSDKEAEKFLHLDDVMSRIPCHLQNLEQHTSPTALPSEDLVGIESAAAACLSATGSGAQLDSLPTERIVACSLGDSDNSPLFKVVKPDEKSLLTSMNNAQAEGTLPITKWRPDARALKTLNQSLSLPQAVEIITSPDWLPEGWVTELKTRVSGNSAGSKDKYYVEPTSRRRFRSRKEVIAYLERNKAVVNDDRTETSPAKKPELSPTLPKKSNKKAKLKESGTSTASAFSSSMFPSIASPGILGNMFMPPFRTGQSSEWLVYESLASLPFPMFDPFYYNDFTGNKSSSGKGSHVPARPWLFTGPEALRKPLMDRSLLSKPGDKNRNFESYFSMLRPSELGLQPSAGGTKKPLKQKCTGL